MWAGLWAIIGLADGKGDEAVEGGSPKQRYPPFDVISQVMSNISAYKKPAALNYLVFKLQEAIYFDSASKHSMIKKENCSCYRFRSWALIATSKEHNARREDSEWCLVSITGILLRYI